MPKLLSKNSGGVALEPVDELTDRKRRRRVDEHVQVVGPDSQVLDPDAKLFGLLPEQHFEPVRYVSNEHGAPSARYPDEMILEHDHGTFVVYVARCHRHIVSCRKERNFAYGETWRRFILSAKAGGFLASNTRNKGMLKPLVL